MDCTITDEPDFQALRRRIYDNLANPKDDPDDGCDFPDGGFTAWSVVVGAWCSVFVSAGWVSCIGDFETYYQSNQLRNYSSSAISWILSVQIFLLFTLAAIFGHIFDSYGPRPLLIGETFFHILGLLLLSISTEYYQIFFTQSLCSAIRASAIFWTAGLTISTWFRRRRGLASGLTASGAPSGGVVGSLAIPYLFQRIGFVSTLRVVAFAYLCLLVVALLTIRSRLKHTPSKFKISDFIKPPRDLDMILVSFAGFFLFLGIYLPYSFLAVEALAGGMSHMPANNLLVILNATGILGRVALAWACDRLGRFNITIISTFIAALLVFAIWIPANNEIVRNSFAALYGIVSGGLLSIFTTLVAQICPDVSKLGAYTGAVFLVMSPGFLVTLPIGGALTSLSLPYLPMKLFCGFTLFVGGIFLSLLACVT